MPHPNYQGRKYTVEDDTKALLQRLLAEVSAFRRVQEDKPSREMPKAAFEMVEAASLALEVASQMLDLEEIEDVRLGDKDSKLRETLTLLEQAVQAQDALNVSVDSVLYAISYRAKYFGVTWKQLGAAMGMSPQGAFKRAQKWPVLTAFEDPPADD